MQRRVLCFGEALIDFLCVGKKQQDGISLPEYRQYPGGAPANAAVAVAKLGGQANFVGQVGADSFGDFLVDSLQHYGVNTERMLRHPQAPTPLAFVSVDSEGERSFAFYRTGTADLLFSRSQIQSSWFADQPILHMCSNMLTTDNGTDVSLAMARQLKQEGGVVSIDANLRSNLWPQGLIDIPSVMALLNLADVIKLSLEELTVLRQQQTESAFIKELFRQGVRWVLVTRGPGEVSYYTPRCHGHVTPPAVTAVDTTAGGDAFIGGFLHQLALSGDRPEQIDEQRLVSMVHFACRCGAFTVSRQGAFPALPAIGDIQD